MGHGDEDGPVVLASGHAQPPGQGVAHARRTARLRLAQPHEVEVFDAALEHRDAQGRSLPALEVLSLRQLPDRFRIRQVRQCPAVLLAQKEQGRVALPLAHAAVIRLDLHHKAPYKT